jgi:hypothetical protein
MKKYVMPILLGLLTAATSHGMELLQPSIPAINVTQHVTPGTPGTPEVSLYAMSFLQLAPGEKETAVALPFHYRKPGKNARYCKQGTFVVLDKDGDCATAGPLQPDKAVILHNREKTILFNLHWRFCVESLIKIAKKEFEGTPVATIKGYIFSNKAPTYDKTIGHFEYNDGTCEPISLRTLQNNLSQEEEFDIVKNKIIKGLGILEPSQLVTRLYTSIYPDCALKDYELAELFIAVKHIKKEIRIPDGTPKGAPDIHYASDISSFCPLAEKYWKDFSDLSIQERISAFQKIFYEKNMWHHRKYGSGTKYGILPFETLELTRKTKES